MPPATDGIATAAASDTATASATDTASTTAATGSARQVRTEAMARLLLSDGAASDRLLRALTSANPANPAYRAIGPAVAHGAAGDEAGRARDEERREP